MTICSSVLRKKRKMINKIKLQRLGDHDEFLNRITKTLYYGKIPLADRFSLPVSELAAELFSEARRGSLDRLHVDQAAEMSRNACVSPCSLVLALLYLERLKTCNSQYVDRVAPSELFLVSMMVASKFLHDDGEEDEVYNDEWATSGGLDLKDMNRLEREFLNAIDWEVYVSEQAFWARLNTLEAELALREGTRRGWFSYTELSQLVHAMELVSLAHTLITVSAVCLTSYTASVLAMVGSTIVVNQLPGVTTSLMTSTLAPVCVTLSPLPPCPTTCLTNRTLPNDFPELPVSWHQWAYNSWDEEDANNQSTEEEPTLTDPNRSYRLHSDDPLKQKDWLKTISDLVRIASTRTYPTMIMPAEVVAY
ncbi:protein CNPPD1 [Homalodisca vitripennis]|uniref:protein CNPPD1 n=1 Tax=Homalodisca vitripennis TaxID=197043 RepID=UPI001EECDB85|nr:protein CNPPD1 [Homalodisca vitripennis]KAG8262794.1 Cyclin-dependent protein kinase [Homalodisca vitripennis]